jgi:hypothetical protein
MTRAAFRDLSNTPQRGLAIRQQKPGLGGVLQQKSVPQRHGQGSPWCNALANPSPAGVGAVQLQPSHPGSAGGQVVRLKFSGTPSENSQQNGPQQQQNDFSAQDPLSLLAPVACTSVSPAAHDLNRQQQQQQNGAKVRDFRRISSTLSSLAPASPAPSLNATQSALEVYSCRSMIAIC